MFAAPDAVSGKFADRSALPVRSGFLLLLPVAGQLGQPRLDPFVEGRDAVFVVGIIAFVGDAMDTRHCGPQRLLRAFGIRGIEEHHGSCHFARPSVQQGLERHQCHQCLEDIKAPDIFPRVECVTGNGIAADRLGDDLYVRIAQLSVIGAAFLLCIKDKGARIMIDKKRHAEQRPRRVEIAQLGRRAIDARYRDVRKIGDMLDPFAVLHAKSGIGRLRQRQCPAQGA
jgi:hypothetical protein